jgi:hypothetical protein
MPKGGNLHVHPAAAMPAAAYVEVTHDDLVYYNAETNMLSVFPTLDAVENGFKNCNLIRKENTNFDTELMSKLLLNHDQVTDKSSADIWKHFEPVFGMTINVFNYVPFYQ